jgi:GntR family transcriptional regulator
MLFQIDSNAGTAVYRQLVDQIRFAAASGTLKPKDPLPTIRPLARQLHLNRNTVAKAYTELESLGVIKTIPGKGCFVEPVKTPFTPAVRKKLLIAKIDAALIAAHQLQVDATSFSEILAERKSIFGHKGAIIHETPTEESPRTPKIPKAPSISAAVSASTPAATSISTGSSTGHDVDGWTPGTD